MLRTHWLWGRTQGSLGSHRCKAALTRVLRVWDLGVESHGFDLSGKDSLGSDSYLGLCVRFRTWIFSLCIWSIVYSQEREVIVGRRT